MTNLEHVIDSYLAAYGEPDALRRRDLMDASLSSDVRLADPPFEAAGHDLVDASFAAVQAQFAGHAFRRTTTVDSHHGAARFGWELRAEDGTVAVAGTDFVLVDAAGRIERIVGFFGDLEPRSAS